MFIRFFYSTYEEILGLDFEIQFFFNFFLLDVVGHQNAIRTTIKCNIVAYKEVAFYF
ncbi:hypothetical protein B0I21_101269 [Sphingobacterium paludis]|uniref:Uncharacterized protein n=1 Tax=Sphingobacterium paludis TaxID=1476465 RepID=A0A4R7DBW7_9SPHI|nr:hypothetical protein B0I21_101269 [Sphingobacterium paludis]